MVIITEDRSFCLSWVSRSKTQPNRWTKLMMLTCMLLFATVCLFVCVFFFIYF